MIEIFDFSSDGLGSRVNAILAERYGVTAKTIRDIRSGRRWGDLTTTISRTRGLKGRIAAAAAEPLRLVDANGRPAPPRAPRAPAPERPLVFRAAPGAPCAVFSAIVRFMEAEAGRADPRWNARFLAQVESLLHYRIIAIM